MAQPHLRLAPRGGYIVEVEPTERWWIQPNVEPFRTESRVLHGSPPFGPDPLVTGLPHDGTMVRMRISEEMVKADLVELEQLGMARRLP